MRGMICAFVGATLWGLSSVCSDYLMSVCGMEPLALTTIRVVIAAVLYCAVAIAFKRQDMARMWAHKPSRRSLAIFGIFGLYACQATYIISISCTNAGTATVMQSLNIVFIPIATWLMGRARLSKGEILGAGLAFVSVVAIATQGDITSLSMPLAGLIWGLINGATESFYVMYPHKLFEKWGSVPVTSAGMVFAALAAVVIWVIYGATGNTDIAGQLALLTQFDAWAWGALLGVSVVGTFVAFMLFLYGVSRIGAVKGSMLGAMEPVSSAALCALLLSTAFTGWDWLGLVLMVGTIFLMALSGKKDASQD